MQKQSLDLSYCHNTTKNLFLFKEVAKRGLESLSDIYISKRGLYSLKLPIVSNQ